MESFSTYTLPSIFFHWSSILRSINVAECCICSSDLCASNVDILIVSSLKLLWVSLLSMCILVKGFCEEIFLFILCKYPGMKFLNHKAWVCKVRFCQFCTMFVPFYTGPSNVWKHGCSTHLSTLYTDRILNFSHSVWWVLLLLLSCFSRVWLCAIPETAVHQAPPSLGFSRQEHWSGLLFPTPMHESEKWKWSCSVVSNS